MTVPARYIDASADFKRFLLDLRRSASLTTTNQAYTVTEGVLLTFRRRLPPGGVARFADVLPPVLRAMFIAGWDPSEPVREFGDEAGMATEVAALRPPHTYSDAAGIHDVAVALRKNVDETAFDVVLAQLPDGAERYWRA
jgi:uncharacterized protein (DUF2267 family)